MKIFSELFIQGTLEQLEQFVNDIGHYTTSEWELVKKTNSYKDYLFFVYKGNKVDNAQVSIHLGDSLQKGELKVGNIVPINKNELSVEEYNNVLNKFYNDIILPYKKSGTGLNISELSEDIFHPENIITVNALEKLKNFCLSANKSTGSSHPLDKERWFDFICQTVDDEKIFDSTTLANFLQDESYWGKKDDDFIGVMGEFAWDEEQAWELASEYEELCGILKYYKETREI
ncbi:hypothetical protein [Clostridium botulinum]|uniref:hypothetical protein n=1 Tax=Clostridium botulinum TaxID=1491 RepID=UPI0007742F57|nr:hypothetical protein [Clostridium botulinum]NFL36791.1 hypothetical protein [Clostridium botulinum]NFL64529.1 hypothetical protein [Clostridium botulinum]NFN06655.1 hypothetical protein [Clostridium botulinum]NFN23519.1 hypothetical protein [Clostridium botulinum]NFN30195.1 hypothetical protein [Clostridium botulinum]